MRKQCTNEGNMNKNLFEEDKNAEPMYMYILNEALPWHKEAKRYWNQLFQEYEQFLDKKFRQQFPSNIINSLWELTLVHYLASQTNHGVELLPILGKDKISTPDFLFSHEDQKFYVEAICPSLGHHKNFPEINRPLSDISGKARKVPINEYRSRLTSATFEKVVNKYDPPPDENAKKKKGYKITINNDGFIIAISMATIPFFHQPGMPAIDIGSFIPNPSTQVTPKNHNGSEIDIFFRNDKYSYVSAVLISHHWPVFFPDLDKFGEITWKNCRNDFLLLHNPYAKVPLAHNVFPCLNER